MYAINISPSDILTKALQPCHGEDLVDRLNNKITASLMFAVGISIFASEYSRNPMQCWAKAEWTSSWIQYASDLCFIEGTYYVPVNETLPPPEHLSEYKQVTMFQWIPFLYYLMGFILITPRIFWHFVSWSSKLGPELICSLAVENFRKQKTIDRDVVKGFTCHLKHSLKDKQKPQWYKFKIAYFQKIVEMLHKTWHYSIGRRYLSFCYFLLKIMNLVTLQIVLFVLSNLVADNPNSWFGYNMVQDMKNSRSWRETGFFPRVSVCHFKVREIGEHEFTEYMAGKSLQCVLFSNFYNEWIFYIVWHWLMLLQVCNVISLATWLYSYGNNAYKRFIQHRIIMGYDMLMPELENDIVYRNWLKEQEKTLETAGKRLSSEVLTENEKTDIKKEIEKKKQEIGDSKVKKMEKREKKRQDFLNNKEQLIERFCEFLGPDGHLVMQLLESNSGTSLCSWVMAKLYWKHCKEQNSASKDLEAKSSDIELALEGAPSKPEIAEKSPALRHRAVGTS